jgi:hypothetical protein
MNFNDNDDMRHMLDAFAGMTAVPPHMLENTAGAARTATEVALLANRAGNSAYQNVANQLPQPLAGYAAQYSGAQQAHLQMSGMGVALGPVDRLSGPAAQSLPFGQLGQLSHGQFIPSAGQGLADYADPAKNRKMQHERALEAMNQLAREKYEPVFQLMGISLTAPWILAMGIVSRPSEWKMEIDLDGKTYRHVWDMLKDDPAEWDAEVGYLLDKVARLRQSLLPPQDAGEPEPVLGAVSGPSRGDVDGGSRCARCFAPATGGESPNGWCDAHAPV